MEPERIPKQLMDHTPGGTGSIWRPHLTLEGSTWLTVGWNWSKRIQSLRLPTDRRVISQNSLREYANMARGIVTVEHESASFLWNTLHMGNVKRHRDTNCFWFSTVCHRQWFSWQQWVPLQHGYAIQWELASFCYRRATFDFHLHNDRRTNGRKKETKIISQMQEYIYYTHITVTVYIKSPQFYNNCIWAYKQKQNSVALVRKRTIPTERPPLVGEVSVNFSG
jgi:hypothetical protein